LTYVTCAQKIELRAIFFLYFSQYPVIISAGGDTMSADLSKLLGARFENLVEATDVDKSQREAVVTANGGLTYYIVDRSDLDRKLAPLGYDIVE
jgi:ABC-type hemin transport system substrate-binding protein